MESTDNTKIINVLKEITEDEKNHVGGLYKLLEILSPTDFKAYEHGYEETLENYK
jgi:rubrerythrin